MNGVKSQPSGRKTMGYEAITVSTDVEVLTAAKYLTAQYAIITVEAQPIRYRTDGTAPAADEGHMVKADGVIELFGADQIANFKVIRQASADATIRCSYMEYKL